MLMLNHRPKIMDDLAEDAESHERPLSGVRWQGLRDAGRRPAHMRRMREESFMPSGKSHKLTERPFPIARD
jgi:hypothetical protein